MDREVQEEAQIGHIVVPEEDALHVEGEVRVAVWIDEARVEIGIVPICHAILVNRCLVSRFFLVVIVVIVVIFTLLQDQYLHLVVLLWHLI